VWTHNRGAVSGPMNALERTKAPLFKKESASAKSASLFGRFRAARHEVQCDKTDLGSFGGPPGTAHVPTERSPRVASSVFDIEEEACRGCAGFSARTEVWCPLCAHPRQDAADSTAGSSLAAATSLGSLWARNRTRSDGRRNSGAGGYYNGNEGGSLTGGVMTSPSRGRLSR